MNKFLEDVRIYSSQDVFKDEYENHSKSIDAEIWNSMFDCRIKTVRSRAQSYATFLSAHYSKVYTERERSDVSLKISTLNVTQVADAKMTVVKKPKSQAPNLKQVK